MKYIKHFLRAFYMIAILGVLCLTAVAGDNLNIYPHETTGGQVVRKGRVDGLMTASSSQPMTISEAGIEFIIGYEGFSPNPAWDYQQYSIGYGNSYETAKKLFGEDCAPITEEQGMELLRYGLIATEEYMNKFYAKNGICLNQNQYDALMSFTYNVGIGWTTYQNEDGTWCKLKTLLLSDPSEWTEENAQAAFGTWVNAGGVQLPGLVKRRAAEAKMFVTPCNGAGDEVHPDVQPDTEIVPEPLPEPESAPTPVISFHDVEEGTWYYSEVMEAAACGLVKGAGDGTFNPGGVLTRASMVQLIANLEGDGPAPMGDSTYLDVLEGSWYTDTVVWATEQGYVSGTGDGYFRPDDPLTREQMCVILARYLQRKGVTAQGATRVYTDGETINSWAREGVDFCTALGLINGGGDGTFAPGRSATRAEAAALMLRIYMLL